MLELYVAAVLVFKSGYSTSYSAEDFHKILGDIGVLRPTVPRWHGID